MRENYLVYLCGHLVQVCDLIEVLCLDLDPRRAHSTRRLTRWTHQQLVHWRGRMYFQLIWWRDVTNDVVAVDANLGQLLNQPFRLVQASMENNLSHHIGKTQRVTILGIEKAAPEKFCNTHTDKGGCCWISKLGVDL